MSFLKLLASSRPTISRTINPSIARRYLSQDVQAKIDKAVHEKPVVLFMKGTPQLPQCGFSRAVVQILDLHDIPSTKVKTYNVLEDQELREAIKEYSSWPTVPQVYVDGEFIGGCDIVMSMHQNGELSKLFSEKRLVENRADTLKPAKQL